MKRFNTWKNLVGRAGAEGNASLHPFHNRDGLAVRANVRKGYPGSAPDISYFILLEVYVFSSCPRESRLVLSTCRATQNVTSNNDHYLSYRLHHEVFKASTSLTTQLMLLLRGYLTPGFQAHLLEERVAPYLHEVED